MPTLVSWYIFSMFVAWFCGAVIGVLFAYKRAVDRNARRWATTTHLWQMRELALSGELLKFKAAVKACGYSLAQVEDVAAGRVAAGPLVLTDADGTEYFRARG